MRIFQCIRIAVQRLMCQKMLFTAHQVRGMGGEGHARIGCHSAGRAMEAGRTPELQARVRAVLSSGAWRGGVLGAGGAYVARDQLVACDYP